MSIFVNFIEISATSNCKFIEFSNHMFWKFIEFSNKNENFSSKFLMLNFENWHFAQLIESSMYQNWQNQKNQKILEKFTEIHKNQEKFTKIDKYSQKPKLSNFN